jgi:spermidine synthase
MLLYACTIFLSAFLLFEVQPMIGKIILPWFGGSAAVWSTCLLFFQASLLAGYLYAHCSTRYLKLRHQVILHVVLMAASLALLPIFPSPAWKPSQPGDPSARILLLLAATIGLPYILLSTTSPLLQAWFVMSKPGAIPYRFFALSNIGSLLALCSFPVLVEPMFSTRAQAIGWSGFYALFVLLCAFVAWRTSRVSRVPLPNGRGSETPVDRSEMPILNRDCKEAVVQPSGPPHWNLQIIWALLAACASALLLEITNHLSQNVAPIPFLWVLPLALYLLSFIICFEREHAYRRVVFLPLLMLSLAGAAYGLFYNMGNLNIKWTIPTFAAALFACCMVCHGELARLKPEPRHLTTFYLMVSLGGALGGLFVAVGAPRLFHTFAELPSTLVACCVLTTVVLCAWPGQWKFKALLMITRIAMAAFTIALAAYLGYWKHSDDKRFELSVRNFYGVLRVYDTPDNEEQTGVRELNHGTINHGTQILEAARRGTATSYYGPSSGIGRAIRYLDKSPSVRIGVIGLGAGVTAAYCRPGDVFRFYEINPLDLGIANSWFTFLKDCQADHDVLMGDARLTMERQPSQQFDLIAVDAFSSDAIPVHLLTREAFVLYFRHLKPNGILAVHVSNRYLNLTPVVSRNAQDVSKAALLVVDGDEEQFDYLTSSDWVLVTSDPAVNMFTDPLFQAQGITRAKTRQDLRPWTDDYSNLFQILK